MPRLALIRIARALIVSTGHMCITKWPECSPAQRQFHFHDLIHLLVPLSHTFT